MCFHRRISGWSSSWRRSRSLAKSWRESSGNWPSRRTTVLGTTPATEPIHAIIPTPAVCLCEWLYIFVRTLVERQERGQVCVCVCVCVRVCVCVYLHLFFFVFFASPYFNHAELSGTCLWASSLQVLEHGVTFWNLSSWSSLTRWDHKYMQLR